MTGEALPAEHNGDIWSREATKHGAILTGKNQRFLLGVSMNTSTGLRLEKEKGAAAAAPFFFCADRLFHAERICKNGNLPKGPVLSEGPVLRLALSTKSVLVMANR